MIMLSCNDKKVLVLSSQEYLVFIKGYHIVMIGSSYYHGLSCYHNRAICYLSEQGYNVLIVVLLSYQSNIIGYHNIIIIIIHQNRASPAPQYLTGLWSFILLLIYSFFFQGPDQLEDPVIHSTRTFYKPASLTSLSMLQNTT
jgi:hypothetical protein